MTDPFMIKGNPSYTWPRVVSVLVLAAFTVLLMGWPSSGPLERRVTSFSFVSAIFGVAVIWFPDHFEDYEHLSGQSLIDKVTPVKYEVSIGWLYLLGPITAWLFMKLV